MNKWTWTLVLAAGAMTLGLVGASQATAQAPHETEATPTEFCGICNAKESVHDVVGEWFSFTLDQRLRVTYAGNTALNRHQTLDVPNDPRNPRPNSEKMFQRYRTRLGVKIKPVESIEIGARLVWEWFVFCQPNWIESTPSSDVPFDELYVKLTNIGDIPLSATIGRQNMRLGNGWLVFEGTPLDGSRTIYFDAIRVAYDLADYDTKLEAVLVANGAARDQYLKPLNGSATDKKGLDNNGDLDDNDESGVILYATNTSRENTTLEGYFIYAHREEPMTSNNTGDLYTFGGRIAGDMGESIKYSTEGAVQFGKKEREDADTDANICPQFGMTAELSYLLKDSLDTTVHAGYEYRSGDKDPEQGFDILWGRYPSFSNILQGGTDALEGPKGALTNFHRFNLGVDLKPWDASVVLLDWHILFVDNNNQPTANGFSDDGCLRGNLFTAQWKVTHNKHMASTVTGEVFLPGDYYTSDRNDVATYARYEMMLTW